jgi:hypothetical protein
MYEMIKMKFKGKDYVQVVERLKFFKDKYENGSIETDIQVFGNKAVASAKVLIDGKIVATGHASKDISKEFELEKCETRAIGRALGIAGIGLDAGIASYDEAFEAVGQETRLEQKVEQIEEKSKSSRRELIDEINELFLTREFDQQKLMIALGADTLDEAFIQNLIKVRDGLLSKPLKAGVK